MLQKSLFAQVGAKFSYKFHVSAEVRTGRTLHMSNLSLCSHEFFEGLEMSEKNKALSEFKGMMDTRHAASYCGYSYGYFKTMRNNGEGPAYYERQVGEKKIYRYKQEDLDLWLDQKFKRVDPAA